MTDTVAEIAWLRAQLAATREELAGLKARTVVDGGGEADDVPQIDDRVEYVGEVPVVTGRVVRLAPVPPRSVLIEDDCETVRALAQNLGIEDA